MPPMGRRGLPGADPQLGASRTRVLQILRSAGTPLGVGDIAERVGLHPNTARFHLDALAEQGLVEVAREVRDAPGRPRGLYTATAQSARAGRRSYHVLAEVLTSYVAAHISRPAEVAVDAGAAWGRALAGRPVPFRRVGATTATARLV